MYTKFQNVRYSFVLCVKLALNAMFQGTGVIVFLISAELGECN